MIEVKIKIDPPAGFDECTDQEKKDWIEYVTGYKSWLSYVNPLHDQKADIKQIEFFTNPA